MKLRLPFLSAASLFLMCFSTQAVAQSFNLISPNDGDTLVVEGNPNSTAVSTWHSADSIVNTPPATYTWKSGLLAFPSDNGGADTTVTFTYEVLDSLLESQGLNVGMATTISWYVEASGGNTVQSDTFNLTLVRGALIYPFSIVSPAGGSVDTIDGLATNTSTFNWHPAGDTVPNYELQVDYTFANFSAPIASFSTTDTFLTLTHDTLEDMLANQGVLVNSNIGVKWRVRAQSGGFHQNTSSRNITFRRGVVLDDFNLTAPPSGDTTFVDGDGSKAMKVNWEGSGEEATYKLTLSVSGNPILTISTAPDMDSLLLPYEDIDVLLEDLGVPIGGFATFTWNVQAYSLYSDSLISSNGPYTATVERGNVIRDYNLLTPSNGTNLNLFGIESKTLDVSWNSAGQNISYTLQFDLIGNNFSNPIASIPNGTDTSISMTYAQVENILIAQGVNVGSGTSFIWTVEATNGTDTISQPPYNLSIIRNPLIRPFDIISPATNISVNYEGRYDNESVGTWESASKTTPLYQYVLDTLGGNFDTPYAVINSDNGGIDTNVTITYGESDQFLEAIGIGINETFYGTWAVRTVVQTDTIWSTSTYNVDLTRGSVIYPFNLNSPAHASGVTIEGNDTNTVDITWHPANDTLVNYQWYLDTLNGDFSNPLLSLPAGSDTSLPVSYGMLNQLLISIGVPLADFDEFKWYTKAITAGDTLNSTDTFNVNLSRGTVLSSFDLLNPSSGTMVNVTGDGTQTISLGWGDGSNGGVPVYDVLVDTISTSNYTAPLASYIANNNGADTNRTISYATLDIMLNNLGYAIGDTAQIYWTSRSAGGFETRLADNTPFMLTLVRGDVIYPFELLSPASNTTVQVTGDANKTVDIEWTSAGEGSINYEFMVDLPSGNFSNPITTVSAGTDTTLGLSYDALETLLINNGVNIGDTVDLIWDVEASNAGGSAFAENGPYNITLIRGSVIQAFDLNNPSDGARVLVQGDATTPVNIDWQSAGNGSYTYRWLLDVQGGNFSPPLFSYPTGSAASLNLDYADVDSILNTLGYGLGDSLEGIWTVRASEGNDVVGAQSVYDIKFVRGVLTVPYNLIGPVDGTSISISGNSSQNLTISWENADFKGQTGTLNYSWLLDELSGDFTNPVLSKQSDNLGNDITLTLPYQDIYNLLVSQGVAIKESKEFKWTVAASFLTLEEFASDDYSITFTRNESVGLDEATHKTGLTVYPNPSSGRFVVELNSEQTGSVQVELVDAIGKTVYSNSRSVNKGTNLMVVNEALKPGFYILRVNGAEVQHNSRVTITK